MEDGEEIPEPLTVVVVRKARRIIVKAPRGVRFKKAEDQEGASPGRPKVTRFYDPGQVFAEYECTSAGEARRVKHFLTQWNDLTGVELATSWVNRAVTYVRAERNQAKRRSRGSSR